MAKKDWEITPEPPIWETVNKAKVLALDVGHTTGVVGMEFGFSGDYRLACPQTIYEAWSYDRSQLEWYPLLQAIHHSIYTYQPDYVLIELPIGNPRDTHYVITSLLSIHVKDMAEQLPDGIQVRYVEPYEWKTHAQNIAKFDAGELERQLTPVPNRHIKDAYGMAKWFGLYVLPNLLK